jgi:hypothetical protein
MPSLDSQGQKNNKENLRTKKEGKNEIKKKGRTEGKKDNKGRKKKITVFRNVSLSPPTFRSKLLQSCSLYRHRRFAASCCHHVQTRRVALTTTSGHYRQQSAKAPTLHSLLRPPHFTVC